MIIETIEAEITAVMPLQRVRDAESRVRNKLSNGPLRAQGNAEPAPEYSGRVPRVFCDVGGRRKLPGI